RLSMRDGRAAAGCDRVESTASRDPVYRPPRSEPHDSRPYAASLDSTPDLEGDRPARDCSSRGGWVADSVWLRRLTDGYRAPESICDPGRIRTVAAAARTPYHVEGMATGENLRDTEPVVCQSCRPGDPDTGGISTNPPNPSLAARSHHPCFMVG